MTNLLNLPTNQLTTFTPTSMNVIHWLEQFDLVVELHEVEAKKIKGLLLTHLAPEVYATMRNIFMPLAITDASITIKMLKDRLKAQYKVITDTRAARQKFQEVRQEPTENVNNFAVRLREAARDCDFRNNLDDRLCDQLVIGMSDMGIKEKVLSEPASATFDKLIEVAQKKEQCRAQLRQLTPSTNSNGTTQIENNVNAIRTPYNNNNRRPSNNQNEPAGPSNDRYNNAGSRCRRCGRDHRGEECRFTNAICHHCGLRGHIQAVCLKKARGEPANNTTNTTSRGGPVNRVEQQEDEEYLYDPRVNQVRTTNQWQREEDTASSGDGRIFHITSNRTLTPATSAIRVEVSIEGRRSMMNLDTGATDSVMAMKQFEALGLDPATIRESTHQLKGYTGTAIAIRGVADVSAVSPGIPGSEISRD
jgi:hypothetical protein